MTLHLSISKHFLVEEHYREAKELLPNPLVWSVQDGKNTTLVHDLEQGLAKDSGDVVQNPTKVAADDATLTLTVHYPLKIFLTRMESQYVRTSESVDICNSVTKMNAFEGHILAILGEDILQQYRELQSSILAMNSFKEFKGIERADVWKKKNGLVKRPTFLKFSCKITLKEEEPWLPVLVWIR